MTTAESWRKLKATNFTTSSFAATLGQSTKTKPTAGDDVGVIEMIPADIRPGACAPDAVLLKFFGTDADGETFNCRIFAWAIEETNQSWESSLIAEFALTLGNLAGAAGCAIAAADFEVDTIVLTYGNDDVDVSIVSPANDVRGAYARIDGLGGRLLTAHFDLGTGASGNLLYRKISDPS